MRLIVSLNIMLVWLISSTVISSMQQDQVVALRAAGVVIPDIAQQEAEQDRTCCLRWTKRLAIAAIAIGAVSKAAAVTFQSYGYQCATTPLCMNGQQNLKGLCWQMTLNPGCDVQHVAPIANALCPTEDDVTVAQVVSMVGSHYQKYACVQATRCEESICPTNGSGKLAKRVTKS